jgi:cell division septum initiation protein DivIVA
MLSSEDALKSVTPTPVEDRHDRVGDLESDPVEPIRQPDRPSDAAARMLELAAITADQLVAGAQAEAASLVTTARASADAILEAGRNEAQQTAAQLSRTRHEQTAELDRERATRLAGLAEETAALEGRIATLRQLESHHRSEMRRNLTEQLALLDATMLEPPAAGAH